MMDVVIDEVDGCMIWIGDHWFVDFVFCNYFGFDFDCEIIDVVLVYFDVWGMYLSWSCLFGSLVLYE